jgi:alpha-ketoglutarate-dependent 2,4-dichlorophenoxyacetate dioxygenase
MSEIVVTRLTPVFAARVDGIDITRELDASAWERVRAAFEEHSVLVFRGQALDDERQVAFSRRFGRLEVTRSMNPAAGTPFARQSNLDIKTGDVIPAGDRRMVYQLANMLWHSDSSIRRCRRSARCSRRGSCRPKAARPSSRACAPGTPRCRTR